MAQENPEFDAAGLESALSVSGLEHRAKLPDARTPIQKMYERIHRSPGFKALKSSDQNKVLTWVGAHSPLGGDGLVRYQAIIRLLGDYKRQSDPKAWLKLMHQQPGLQQLTGDVDLGDDEKNAVHWTVRPVGIVKDHQFAISPHRRHHGPRDARKYYITTRGSFGFKAHKIALWFPLKHFPGEPGHSALPNAKDVAKALARVDPAARALIREINVNPANLPGEAADTPNDLDGLINLYPNSDDMSAGAGMSSRDVLEDKFEHESGHVATNLTYGIEVRGRDWDRWRRACRADKMRASTYARSEPAEDFAESWALYLQSIRTSREHELKVLMPARYKELARMYDNVRKFNGRPYQFMADGSAPPAP